MRPKLEEMTLREKIGQTGMPSPTAPQPHRKVRRNVAAMQHILRNIPLTDSM